MTNVSTGVTIVSKIKLALDAARQATDKTFNHATLKKRLADGKAYHGLFGCPCLGSTGTCLGRGPQNSRTTRKRAVLLRTLTMAAFTSLADMTSTLGRIPCVVAKASISS